MAVKKTAKKSAVKKTAKKSAVKKTAKKAVKKSAVKKSSTKKVVKKTAVKKTAKKAVKKTAKKTVKRASSAFVVPAVPASTIRTNYQSSSVTSRPAKTPGASVPSYTSSGTDKPSSSKRVVTAVVIAVVLIALLVVSRNGSTTTESAAPEETASAQASQGSATEESAEPTTEASAEATGNIVDQGGSQPVGIVAQYTSTGATIFWKAPINGSTPANYNVEIRSNGGEWKLISTVPGTQFAIDISKADTTGWASFRISSVLEDGTVDGGKVFGLPGQWA